MPAQPGRTVSVSKQKQVSIPTIRIDTTWPQIVSLKSILHWREVRSKVYSTYSQTEATRNRRPPDTRNREPPDTRNREPPGRDHRALATGNHQALATGDHQTRALRGSPGRQLTGESPLNRREMSVTVSRATTFLM